MTAPRVGHYVDKSDLSRTAEGSCKWRSHLRGLTAVLCSLQDLRKTDISCNISVKDPLDSTSAATFYLLISNKSKETVSLTISSVFLEMKLSAMQIQSLTHTVLLVKWESQQMSKDLKSLISVICHILITCVASFRD